MKQSMSASDIRAVARGKLLGKYRMLSGYVMLVLLIEFFISNLIYSITLSNIWMILLAEMIGSILINIFVVGFIRICMKVVREESIAVDDLFYVVKHDPDKIVVISFISWFLRILIQLTTILDIASNGAIVFNTVTQLGIMAVMAVVYVYGYILLSQCYFIYFDYPEYGAAEILQLSISMMKNNKLRFFGLLISIFGMFIMVILTLGIGVFWILPYMHVSMIIFYEDLKGEQNGHHFEVEG